MRGRSFAARWLHPAPRGGEAPPKGVRTTDSRHAFPRYENLVKTLEIEAPEHVWVADITYVKLEREFVYLAVILDVFTRLIRGWHLGRSLDQGLTLAALERALLVGTPRIHHSDQGVQYAATAYVTRLTDLGVVLSMAKVGEPRENGYAERLMRTIKEEEVTLSEYRDYADARRQIGFLGHGIGVYEDLSARENLAFFAHVCEVKKAPAVVENWLERVKLSKVAGIPVRQFSRGMRQRLALARTFPHSPNILLLDEPFTSLDDRAIQMLSELLIEARGRGATIILSTHQIREALAIASHVALIENGRLRHTGERTVEMLEDPGLLYRMYTELGAA